MTDAPTPAAATDTLLRLTDVAARLGVAERTVRRLIASDATFPRPVLVGVRSRRIRARDLAAWIAAREVS